MEALFYSLEHAAMAKFLIRGAGEARESSQDDPKAARVVDYLDNISQLNK